MISADPPRTWVIGAGGLLGQAVVVELGAGGAWEPGAQFSWGDQSTLSRQFDKAVAEFSEVVSGAAWRIVWCAGVGTVSSSRDFVQAEGRAIALLVSSLRTILGHDLSRGTFFFSSSAGAIHSGSDGTVANEKSVPTPLTFYGEEKLAVERFLESVSHQTGLRLVVGRLSNLYGPNQNLNKPQGIISNICALTIKRKPVPVFVSLRTIRNYLHSDDAAKQICYALRNHEAANSPTSETRLFHSMHEYSVGEVLKICSEVMGIEPLVQFIARSDSERLSYNTRFSSAKVSELLTIREVPFPVGVRQTFDSVLRAYQLGRLAG